MARKQKPVKIKRYKNSMGSSAVTVHKVKQLLPIVAAVLAIVLVGFLLGKPVLNMLSGAGKGDSSSSSQIVDTSSKLEDSSVQTDVSQPSSDVQSDNPQPEIVQPVAKTRIYYYADTSALSTEAGIDGVIAQMKSKGATHLVFDVKNQDGNLLYTSANQYGSQLVADKTVDIKALVSKLSQNGITPVARMYTFMDKLISNVERSTAVMYQGTDTRWLDSSAALGGKAWANPASQIMRDYIISLTDEVMSLGIKEIVYAGFHTPTGYSLDKRDFGATMDQVLASMRSLYNTLEAKVSAKGGRCSLQVEYSALMPEGNYSHYIVHPYQLGAENIIITAKGVDTDVQQAVSQLAGATDAEDISSVTLWLTDNVNTETAKSLGDYFAD
ncbi:MAG: hypothetical protein IKY90_01540 [Oscillospiraceae bacterium]|nr:hypothetical protein [Oscillospiraceae bacterium]